MNDTLRDILEDYKAGMSLERVYKKYGGVSIYIPKVDREAKEKIIQEFNGYNFLFLAHKFNLSERYVREIVRGARQKSLFDGEDDTISPPEENK